MEILVRNLEGTKQDPQGIQVLIPLRRLSLNSSVCRLRSCLMVGYCNKDLPLEETIFLDTWDIVGSKD